MKLIKVLGMAVLLAPALVAQAHEYKVGDLEVAHPWARETPPGATTAAVYLTVKNKGASADKLVGAETSAAGMADLHQSQNKDGTMTMVPVQAIDIPAKGRAKLVPMGYHLMLMDLKAPLKVGQKVPVTLKFEKAGSLPVEVEVQNKDFKGEGH
ncbi:TPA: copper chaperone PCu(A)C [Pseudomonas aeruginosa]